MKNQNCWLKDNCKGLHCEDSNGCLILYKLNFLFDQAGVSDKQRVRTEIRIDADGTDFEEFTRLKNIEDNITDFVNNGKNLYLHSSGCGNGKTLWSLRLMQAYFNKIWLGTPLKCRGLFINVPALLLALKDNISNRNEYIAHIKENIYDADLVIWDDISAKSGTEFEVSNLFSFIDQRINLGKANIYTSNINPENLEQYLGARLASRISNCSACIEFKGADKRFLVNEK